jgi:hypothetical protein
VLAGIGTIATVIAGAGGLPASADASVGAFGRPIALKSTSTSFVASPAVSVADSGQVVVAWEQQLAAQGPYGVVARRGTSGGKFGSLARLTGSGFEPSAAAGLDGGASVVWESLAPKGGTRHLEASVAVGRGRFGKPQTLASVRATITSQTVLATGGHYVAIWRQGIPGTSRHAVRYAVSNGVGHFGAVRTLVADTGPISGVSAAVRLDGTVTAAWGTPLGAPPAQNQQLAFAQLPVSATTFGPIADLQAQAADQGAETVGIDVDAGPGGTSLAWTEDAAFPELLRTAPVVTGVPPVAQTVLSVASSDLSKTYGVGPVLALPADGLAPVAAYAVLGSPGGESEAVTSGSVFAAEPSAGGVYGTPVELSDPGTIATQPVAGANNYAAVVAWTTGAYHDYGLKYAVRLYTGSFSDAESLSPRRSEGPVVLASSTGSVVAAWVAGGAPNRLGIDIAILGVPAS